MLQKLQGPKSSSSDAAKQLLLDNTLRLSQSVFYQEHLLWQNTEEETIRCGPYRKSLAVRDLLYGKTLKEKKPYLVSLVESIAARDLA